MRLQTGACLPMVAFRFELDDHDDEEDGSSSGDDYHDHGDNSQIRLPNSVYANAGVHIRPQRAKVTNRIPLHSMATTTSTLHTVSTF